jgi:serine/threonine protein kinase
MTPTVLEFILDLSKRNQLKLFEDITVEDLRWGEPLAQGTSGRVYKGEWKHQPVAIKKFFVADPPIIRNELGLISVLKHPNLVECFGGFVSDGTALFVTELMDCNLFELLRTKTTLDFGTKIKLAIDIAEGMTFLHSRNIIHRDLKSVNVLIQLGTIDMVAKVCDFGLSRVIDNGTKMTGNVGTIAWIAPEVFQNKKYSEMCDVYSFGVILYELLTHTTPFKELASFRIPSAVVKGKRPTLPTDALNVPKAYLSLMKHCWHQNPAKRPPFSEILKILGSLAPSNIIGPTSSYNFSASTTSESESIDMDDSTRTDSSEFMYGTYQDMEEQVSRV